MIFLRFLPDGLSQLLQEPFSRQAALEKGFHIQCRFLFQTKEDLPCRIHPDPVALAAKRMAHGVDESDPPWDTGDL